MKWSTLFIILGGCLLIWVVSATVNFFRDIDYSKVADLDQESGRRWFESLSRDYSTTERYERSGNLSDHPLMHGGWKYDWSKGDRSWSANSAFITGDNQDHLVIQIPRVGRHVETGYPADIVSEIVIDVENKTFILKTFFVKKFSRRLLGLWTDKKLVIPDKYIPMNLNHGTFSEQSDGTYLFKYYFVSTHEVGRKIPNDAYGTVTLTRVNKKMQYAWSSTSHPIEPLASE